MDASCTCKPRRAATVAGEFFISFQLGGWVFAEGPVRRMSVMAAYYAIERGVTNHSGERFVWITCPWCGADLPPADHETLWRIITKDDDE